MSATSATLQYAADVCGPLVLTAQSPSGPDGSARFTLSGTHAGASVVFEKVATAAEYAAESWTPLSGVVRQDTFNVCLAGVLVLSANQTVDVIAPSLFGLYAVRCRLTAITSGTVAAQAVTTARSLTDSSAFLSQVALELTRIRFAVALATGLSLDEIDGSGTV